MPPLVPQQDVIVIEGPYIAASPKSVELQAAEILRDKLEDYPPCRIISISSNGGKMHAYSLTAVVETV